MNTAEPISPYAKHALHDPALYTVAECATGIAGGFDAITQTDLADYHAKGYLVIQDAFTPQEVQDALDGMVHLVNGGVPQFRSIQFEAEALDQLDTLTPEQRQDAVRKLAWFSEFEPRLKAMSHHPKMLALIASLLGNTPEMYQDQMLIKPPKLGREKPWHQDMAYFNLDKREQSIGIWIALDETDVDNGCMHLLPQLGREPIVHFQRRDWQLCDTLTFGQPSIAVPLKPGGALVFDGMLVHGTPHNQSNKRRRAMQIHWHANRFPKIPNEQRLETFGEEGRDVTC